MNTPKNTFFGFFVSVEIMNARNLITKKVYLDFPKERQRATYSFFCFFPIFVQANEQKLWFGRDYFGRRSLLWHLPTDSNDVLAVTSVTERNSSATDKLVFVSFSFLSFFSLTFHFDPFPLA